jgi:hypothetical protein
MRQQRDKLSEKLAKMLKEEILEYYQTPNPEHRTLNPEP